MSWILCKFRSPSSQKGHGRTREGPTEKGRKCKQKYGRSIKIGKEMTEVGCNRNLQEFEQHEKKSEK